MVSGQFTAARGQTRLGIALSSTEMCVVDVGNGAARQPAKRFALAAPGNDNGAVWPSLADALRELARSYGGGELSVALMNGLAEVRRLELPPMRADDLRQLLTRNAARYFVRARSAQVIGALNGARRASAKGASGVLAVAASARLIASIHAAARESGWTVRSIAPAEGAWASAATVLWPGTARTSSHLLVLHDDRTDLFQLDEGELAAVRRFRPGAADEALIAEAIVGAERERGRTSPPLVSAAGRSDIRNVLSRALASRGVALASPPAEWAESAESPDVLAAAFDGPKALPALESDDQRASVEQQTRRVVRYAAWGAAACLILAAALELWGVHRELGAVRAQRAALRSQVAATLVGRTSVETAFRQLATLAAAQRLAPRWSGIVAGLSESLPADAYLTAFRGRGDSVVVDGLATHAARAFDAVEKTPGLVGVRAAAPVRREAPSGGPAMERFTIAAQVAPARPARLANGGAAP
jgi:hypothetical protein